MSKSGPLQPLDILIVDDEADIRELVSGILSDEGYNTRTAGDSDSALREIRNRRPALVILDIWLQGSRLDGLQVLDEIKKEHPDLPVLVISGHGNIETAVTAITKGAYDFVEKPFKADRILLTVERALEAQRLRKENESLKERLWDDFDLVGQSHAISQLRQMIEKIAPTNSRLLISGNPGSGKGVVARLIHAKSRRQRNPFIAINCATIAPERMEIELFGVEGANEGGRKVGLFEQAHGGTLFVDEIADMPLETQGKILRVLVEQNFQRVGGGPKVQVDVRVVSSCSADPRMEIGDGRLREDLYHRLNVVCIRVPPLTERREDMTLCWSTTSCSAFRAQPACSRARSVKTRWRPSRRTAGPATSVSCATTSRALVDPCRRRPGRRDHRRHAAHRRRKFDAGRQPGRRQRKRSI